MIERWNSVVRPGDIVYHLGDVVIRDDEWFKKNWPRLQGSKRLIVGNHDDIKFLTSGAFFKKVLFWRQFRELGLVFSHMPLHLSSMNTGDPERPLFCCHGHIHHNPSPRGPYRNVCVEVTDYTPVHIDTLAAEAKTYFDTQWEKDRAVIYHDGV